MQDETCVETIEKVVAQYATIVKGMSLFQKICYEASFAMEEPMLLELINKRETFEQIDKDLRADFSNAKRKTTWYWLIVTKYQRLEPELTEFLMRFSKEFHLIRELEAGVTPDTTNFYMKTESEQNELVQMYCNRSRTAVEWRVNFEDLKRQWNSEKKALLQEVAALDDIIFALNLTDSSVPSWNS